MKQEINRNEWIEAYLKGELPADEAAKVKELIATDAGFAKEVDSAKELHEIIMDSSLIDIKKELSAIHLHKVNTDWINKITRYGSGAIVLGLLTFYVLKDKPENKVAEVLSASDTTNTIVQNTSHDEVPNDTMQIEKNDKAKPTQPAINKKDEIAGIVQQTSGNINMVSDTMIASDNITENKVAMPAKETQTLEKKQAPRFIDCSKVRIKVGYTSEESCNNSATGSITLIKESVKGGKMPYLYSLSKKDFSDSVTFRNLTSNIYNIYVKDANNCIVRAASILVGRKDCSVAYQEIFAPLNGEIWQIPVKQGGEGNIQIFSKNGSLVYTTRVSPNDPNVWNGENMSRQMLPMGVYQFIIKYSDGGVFAGNVTIKK